MAQRSAKVRLTSISRTAVCTGVATILVAGAPFSAPSGITAQSAYDQVPAEDAVYVDDRDWSDEVPAHLSVVDGQVQLEREGRVEDADENIILLAGDRLRTSRGRAEVLFADGSALVVDEFTTVDLLDDSLMRLFDGRVRLAIARTADRTEYRVDTAAGSAFIVTAGEYRLTASTARGELEFDVAVLRGQAELTNDRGRTLVRAGTYAAATAGRAPSLPYTFNAAAFDALDRWAEDQERARLGYTSTRYLPAEVSYYAGAFDRYGTWGHEPSYGYVWYPTVDISWRPYSAGRWVFYGRFGWTWVGAGRWAWPTHHYGRWGLSGTRWFWIPERRWAPAWVSWASAPGYVGWCPLGFDNRPVISITHVTIRGGDRWRGWNVVPDHAFRNGFAVSRYAVAGRSIQSSVATRFASRPAPQAPQTFARSAPLRAPGLRNAGTRTAVARPGLSGARDFGSSAASRQAQSPGSRQAVSPGSAGRAGSVARDPVAPSSTTRGVVPRGTYAPPATSAARPGTSTAGARTNRAVPSSRAGVAAPPASRSTTPDRTMPNRQILGRQAPDRPNPTTPPAGRAQPRTDPGASSPPSGGYRRYDAGSAPRATGPDRSAPVERVPYATPSRHVSPDRGVAPSREIAPNRSAAPSRGMAPGRSEAPGRAEAPSPAVRRGGGVTRPPAASAPSGSGSRVQSRPAPQGGRPAASPGGASGSAPAARSSAGGRRQAPPSSSGGGQATRRTGRGGGGE